MRNCQCFISCALLWHDKPPFLVNLLTQYLIGTVIIFNKPKFSIFVNISVLDTLDA